MKSKRFANRFIRILSGRKASHGAARPVFATSFAKATEVKKATLDKPVFAKATPGQAATPDHFREPDMLDITALPRSNAEL